MRVRITFNLNNRGAILPFHHQHLIAGLVRNLLQDANDMDLSHVINNISFSGVKGQTKVGKSGLHYCSNKVTVVFSSYSEEYLQKVIGEIFNKRYVHIGKLNVSPEKSEKEIFNGIKDEVKYLCISPIIIAKDLSDHYKPLNLFSDTLSDILYESIMLRVEKSGLFTSEEIESFFNFQIVVDRDYIKKANDSGKKISRIYKIMVNGVKKEFRGYTFPFTLYANPKIQKFILDTGFGEYSSSGFGMLDVVNKDVVIENYELPQQMTSSN